MMTERDVINHTESVKHANELVRFGFRLYAAYAAQYGNPIESAEAKDGSRVLNRTLRELDKKVPYTNKGSAQPPEVERLGAYINPHNSAKGAARLAAIVELGDRLDVAQKALDDAVARGAPYHCDHSIWEIKDYATTCVKCASVVAGDEFAAALRAVDPFFYMEFDGHGFPDNPKAQIAAAAAELAEAWSYFRAFCCQFDSPERNATVGAIGVEIAMRKLKTLTEHWESYLARSKLIREERRWPKRLRRRPLYRKINGERVRIYRPDEIDPVEPLEDSV